ncbi:hypothetical protein FF1_046419 [Malus domestica]
MLRLCYRLLERCLGLRFGAGGGGDGLWHMDLKPYASGNYSIAVVQANSNLEDQGQVFTSPSATYVPNLGDSRAVLGRRVSNSKRSPVVAKRMSTYHNMGVEEVRKEVEALHPDDSHVMVYTRGVWRIKGIIQVQWDSFNGAEVCSCVDGRASAI